MSEEYDKYYKKGGSYELPAEIFNDLLEQLQAYKNKEDKLRELITAPIDGMSLDILGRDILQILNEGDMLE